MNPEFDSSEKVNLEELDNSSIIERYIDSDGEDVDCARVLSARLFKTTKVTENPETIALMAQDGKVVEMDGKKLSLINYIEWAAYDHPQALNMIFTFLVMSPNDKDYKDMFDAVSLRAQQMLGM